MRFPLRPLLLAIPILFVLPPAGTAGVPVQPDTVPCLDPRGCPDLLVDERTFNPYKQERFFAPGDCSVAEGSAQPGVRTLLRFTFTSPNLGAGDLIVGRPELNPQWFQWGECHGHWHFREYADYRLWTQSAFAEWDALRLANPTVMASEILDENPHLRAGFVAGHKQGFCVIDISGYQAVSVRKYLSCSFQGISAGWADEYGSGLDGQWIDVTGVPAGTYVIESEVNPERLFEESDYSNNRAWRLVNV